MGACRVEWKRGQAGLVQASLRDRDHGRVKLVGVLSDGLSVEPQEGQRCGHSRTFIAVEERLRFG